MELKDLFENRQEQFEKYMHDMLEARLKLASPLLFYNSDKAYVKRVQKQVKEEEEQIKSNLRNYKINT